MRTSSTSTATTRDGDVFHVNWKPDPSWSGTCRKVAVRLAGASDGTAVFRFP